MILGENGPRKRAEKTGRPRKRARKRAGQKTGQPELSEFSESPGSDEARQTIPWVEYNSPGGKSVVYATPGAKADGAGLDIREMDCMDCHNRPSHTYELPDRAVERAMAAGLVSPALPFAKRKAVEILKVAYPSRDEAARRIPEAFAAYYRQSYPAVWSQRQAQVTSSGNQVLAIYDRNIFPDMNVTWGKYPNNIGHTDFPG